MFVYLRIQTQKLLFLVCKGNNKFQTAQNEG